MMLRARRLNGAARWAQNREAHVRAGFAAEFFHRILQAEFFRALAIDLDNSNSTNFNERKFNFYVGMEGSISRSHHTVHRK